MEKTNAGVVFTDAGVLALLADTSRAGRGGYGYGGYGGEGGGMGGAPFAGFASNAVRTNCVEKMVERNSTDGQFREVRHQVDHLASQLAQCCCDNKVLSAELLGKIDCMQGVLNNLGDTVHKEIQICIDQQTIADLRAQISNDNHHRGG